jgi:hypothetical protein
VGLSGVVAVMRYHIPPVAEPETQRVWKLCGVLKRIEEHDTDYEVRYGLVLDAIALAHQIGYPAGFRIDPDEPGWPVAVIELPTGQVSWHMPEHPTEWDGHETPEKYRRVLKFILENQDKGMTVYR